MKIRKECRTDQLDSAEVMTEIRTLAVGVQNRICALPLPHIIEIMRPLHVEPIAKAPSYVQGVSIIRGTPTPVVDLGSLLGTCAGATRRFVTIRLGARQVALAVERVFGIHEVDATIIQALPPLLRQAAGDTVEAVGTLDAQLLLVLRTAWEVPDEVWQALSQSDAAATSRSGAVQGGAWEHR